MQLIIAEKHSVGENIARVLGVTNKKNGYIEGNNIIVSWCVGHIMALALPNDEQYGENIKTTGRLTISLYCRKIGNLL